MTLIDIDPLKERIDKEVKEGKVLDGWAFFFKVYLDDAPTVDADRSKGEWIEEYHGNGWNDYWDYTCSNCGKKYERADDVLYKANFCPNCGADMREKRVSK